MGGAERPGIYAWFPREPPRGLAELEASFRRIAGGRSLGGRERWFKWTAWDRATDAPVGLVEATAREDGRVALAYMVRPALWRRGYGREAVAAVIDALFAVGAAALKFAFVERRTAVEWFKDAWGDEELWRLTCTKPQIAINDTYCQQRSACQRK